MSSSPSGAAPTVVTPAASPGAPPETAQAGESDEQLRLLIEGVQDYAIFMLDESGRVASWNAGAQHIKGYAAAEIIGRHFSVFYPAEAKQRRWPEHELHVARVSGRFEDEGWRVRKDGSMFWANVIITTLHDRQGRPRGFAKVTRDLTARRQVEELRNTERQMTEFLAMLAHELRNPLAPIQTALDIMALRPDDLSKIAWSRDLIARQVRQLTRLVDDLLDVSRITCGKIKLQREPVDLAPLIAATVDTLRPRVAARQQVIEVSLPQASLPVMVDTVRFTQVIANLVNNAIKYTPDGGRICVRASVEDDSAIVVVGDNGIGIAQHLLTRIFDVFVQGDRALDRGDGGLGIGLALVKRLVELHSGSVSAHSAGPGHGSEFTLSLPLIRADAPKGVDLAPAALAQPRTLRILVVDDNNDAATTIATLLKTLGHDVRVAGDGLEALDAAPAFRPHVVLLDIGLPLMDGYKVASRLAQMPSMADTVLVACTGYGNDRDRERAVAAGFHHHLVKPVDSLQLEQILDSVTA